MPIKDIRERKEYTKQWRATRSKEWKERKKAQHAAWYLRNKELQQKKNKEWRKIHHKEVVEKTKERRKNDPCFRIACNCRARMRDALKLTQKIHSTIELIGCSTLELKTYLEKMFKNGMTWENYGSYWHIDHIKPCASFNLINKEEQLKCFHYTNLQPLEAKENLRKGRKEAPLTSVNEASRHEPPTTQVEKSTHL